MMSRYVLQDTELFGEIVFGWDKGIGAFFVQCFQLDEEDEEPARWHPNVTLLTLEAILRECGAPFPDLARRVLIAEQTGNPIVFQVGDPVAFRDSAERLHAGRVVDIRSMYRLEPGVLVEHSDGSRWMHAVELEPDLLSLGVN